MPQFSYSNGHLSSTVNGTYSAVPPLANITIAGVQAKPSNISFNYGGWPCETGAIGIEHNNGTVYLNGFEQHTPNGAWASPVSLHFGW